MSTQNHFLVILPHFTIFCALMVTYMLPVHDGQLCGDMFSAPQF